VDDENGRKALVLIEKRASFEPAIKRRISARELGNIMRGR